MFQPALWSLIWSWVKRVKRLYTMYMLYYVYAILCICYTMHMLYYVYTILCMYYTMHSFLTNSVYTTLCTVSCRCA
jgi:hypothetical protein